MPSPASRLTGLVISLSLVAVGTTTYLSPIDRHHTAESAASLSFSGGGGATLRSPTTEAPQTPSFVTATSTPKATTTTTTVAHPPVTEKVIIERQVVQVIHEPAVTTPAPATTTTTTTPSPTTTTCGASGNQVSGNLGASACAATTTTTTTTPQAVITASETKSQLVTPGDGDYYGVAMNGVPMGTSELNALDVEVGKAPSVLEWYEGWDQGYNANAVQTAWQRGALPILTWESMPSIDPEVDGSSRATDPAYSLTNILDGEYDSYIQSFAQSVVATGLPVVIRLDQEMNGNWYPWSEDTNGNSLGQYAAMWRHVWNIFQAAGANSDVIWLWAPNRVDQLGNRTGHMLSELYPGDQYVDWMGMDGYYRYAGNPTDFSSTYGATLSLLDGISTTKPIFLAEVGAIETDPTTGASISATKATWTSSFLAGVLATPQIIGFAWFDNVATNVVDGNAVSDDWRLDSDPQTLEAFKAGISTSLFLPGISPTTSSSPS